MKGNRIAWAPVKPVGSEALAFLASGARIPAHTAILKPGHSQQPLAPQSMPADFPFAHLVDPQKVIFPAADGMRIDGQLFLRKIFSPVSDVPLSCSFIRVCADKMLLGFYHRGYYHNAYAFNQYLASREYIVLSVNYRSGIGYGMAFREVLNYGASEFNHVLGAGLYLRSRPEVDPKRIGLWAGSYCG